MIPKIIHYCWLSNDPIPAPMKTYVQKWKKLLPEYKFILWNFTRFNQEDSLWVKEAFQVKKYAFAADYIRLYALYSMGGIYLDMDVEIVKKFDSLLERQFILGFEHNKGIEGGIIGSEPGAVWLKKCLDYYEKRHFILTDGSYDTTPLPIILFSILKENHFDMTEIFSFDYLTAKSLHSGKITITPNTYTIHHFSGTWLTPWQRMKQFIKPYFYKLGIYGFAEFLYGKLK